ncbi:4Fe-4S ferredoxin N-terminal domain-containing protein [Natronolimnohabitans sp. A-GB9]|uniref:4Fe-4S ferredoxin N-terminal domain-containing protein n=1 Tax=Natronolimnohabitans sp. A-GB9 TaxID=3069757 RepID=UPI0027AF19BF|nr:4Fe-4S ferredoxin N-terminal domain-containing protein [Natronolimnohabitans sp. A-GB9]MDQ2048921.1 4Fe-4S ferredoxin N-terminal domain-containing protein [Natronolimnohabitans sp. A-GB9]
MSADDESFHPLGKEWEGELEEMLDDTEYDTDLGMEMAQDAMRVTKGELSEAEFHEKYHDDVMDEFGVDDRPTEEAYEAAQEEAKGTVGRMLSAFDGDGEETRRETMKKMGVGAAAVGLGAWGATDDGPEADFAAADDAADGGDDDGIQWGMTIDLERCDGCLSCVDACSEENQLDQGVNWMYVLQFADEDNQEPGHHPAGGFENMLVRPCQHCTDAPCEKVCPTTARHTRDQDGLVLTDYDVCIGCRYCQVACPYGVNYFQWNEPDVEYEDIPENASEHPAAHVPADADPEDVTYSEYDDLDDDRWVDARAPRGVMSKCTMCPTHQDGSQGEEHIGHTACEDACPPGAIQFGNVNDELSDPQRYAENPSRGRSLERLAIPDPEELEDALEGEDDDLESVLDAVDFQAMDGDITTDAEGLGILLALEITGGEQMGNGPEVENHSDFVHYEQEVLDVLEVLEDHGLDLDSQEVLAELDLADPLEEDEDEDDDFEPDEDDAQFLLQRFAGVQTSSFKLLEEYGTNPNITYIGSEPGPNAEQIEGPVQYDSVDLTDNRKEVLDDDTVTGGMY